MFVMTPEALYESSWTGPMLFSMDCSTLYYKQVLAFTKAWSMPSIRCVLSVDQDFFFFFITKTCLYNIDPLKPHFYIVKLGFTGVYIIFIISAQYIDCGYTLEPTHRGGSNEYPRSMF